ncbi:MAG: PhoX family phosphatase, partial [Betaproteobacteria bacterium]
MHQQLPQAITSQYEDEIVNPSTNPPFEDVLAARVSRRQTILGGISATTAALLGTAGLSACGGSDPTPVPVAAPEVKPLALGFTAVAKNTLDVVTVPEGYQVSVLHALGD